MSNQKVNKKHNTNTVYVKKIDTIIRLSRSLARDLTQGLDRID